MATDSDPLDLFDISQRVVVITGASGLLGRALCVGLGGRGARVVAVDLESADPSTLLNIDGVVAAMPADVSKSADTEMLTQRVWSEVGLCDVLINCHQFKPSGFLDAKAETFDEDLWDSILEANLKGSFLTCRDFGARMLEQGHGSIINFSSTYGIVSSNPSLYADNSMGNPLAYSVSKAGVSMLTKYLGVHWASRGVRVNAVAPHGLSNNHEQEFVERFTQLSPMGRMSTTDEVLGIVVYLCSDASTYTTGATHLVEGGWTAW